MKERVGDEKPVIISVAVRGINDHIRFYSQMLNNVLLLCSENFSISIFRSGHQQIMHKLRM